MALLQFERLLSIRLATFLLAIGTATVASGEHFVHRFDFGTGPVEPGYQKIDPTLRYGGKNEFGFDLGTVPTAVDRNGDDPLRQDFVTSDEPFYFSIRLPEGNYNVTLLLGDSSATSDATIKAESRRLMLEQVRTRPGHFAMQTFTVNLRTPEIQSGGQVSLKQSEVGTLQWDNKLTIEFNGSTPAVCGMEITVNEKGPTVYLLGDSTVTDQPNEPWNSWGQMLPRFFAPGVAVSNHACSGETLRGALSRGRVRKIFSTMRPGDYVFVQFGHNDMKETDPNALDNFKKNLSQIISDVRMRQATPVLVTSMERKAGINKPTLSDYPEAMREVARDKKANLIDLHRMSLTLYRALGEDLDRAFQDGTHHNSFGSYQLAKCMVRGIQLSLPELSQHLREDSLNFNPTKPDSPASFGVGPSPQVDLTKPDGN